MRLRVSSGMVPAGALPAADLSVVFRSPSLTIEASPDVMRLDTRTPAFLAGHVVGVRPDPSAAVGRGPAGVDAIVEQQTADAVRGRVEGAFLVAAVRANGSCDVFADRFGKRDLYIQRVGAATIAATDLALLPVSRGHDGFDSVGVAHTLTVYGWRPAKKHTLYAGVSRLGVGETLRLAGEATIQPAAFAPASAARYSDADLERYADLLLDAVASRASARGNVVYLSSGWDSTSLLGCLVHLLGPEKIRCAIARLIYSERSGVINKFEISRAADVAAFYGVPLEIVDVDYRQAGPDVLEELAPMLRGQQLASMTAMTHGLLARHVSRTTRGDETVFAGEISDGAHNLGFSQYVTIFHPVLDFREYSDKMASYLFGPTFLGSLTTGTYTDDVIYQLLRGRAGGLEFDAWQAGPLQEQARRLFASFFLRGVRLPLVSLRSTPLLTEAGRHAYADAMERTYLRGAADAVTPETLYAWYLWLYNSFHWQGSTVGTIAATAEAEGLRLALPFWDSRVQDFLSAMPESWGRGLDLHPTKYPLKWMLKHRVRYPMHLQVGPHSYLYDVDHSFNLSFEILYHSSFAPYFRERLRERRYQELLPPDTIDVPYIDGLVQRYLGGEEVSGGSLNDLVSICWLSAVGWFGA